MHLLSENMKRSGCDNLLLMAVLKFLSVCKGIFIILLATNGQQTEILTVGEVCKFSSYFLLNCK